MWLLDHMFMASKLLKLNINPRLILWIVDFLVNRSQTVHHQTAILSSRSLTRHCPVSYSFWHSLQITTQALTSTTPIIKYSDNSAIYFAEVEKFSNLCRDNSLDLNDKENKENADWFQKSSNSHSRSLCWWCASLKSDQVQISRNSLRQQAEF